jgi:hypothetical protein
MLPDSELDSELHSEARLGDDGLVNGIRPKKPIRAPGVGRHHIRPRRLAGQGGDFESILAKRTGS